MLGREQLNDAAVGDQEGQGAMGEAQAKWINRFRNNGKKKSFFAWYLNYIAPCAGIYHSIRANLRSGIRGQRFMLFRLHRISYEYIWDPYQFARISIEVELLVTKI